VSSPNAEPTAETAVPAQAVRHGLFGRPLDDEDDRPLPDLPPLPEDPRWRLAHLPMVAAAGMAFVLFAATIGFLTGGPTAALGAAAGVFVVSVGLTMSTLVIAWADAVNPALIMPLGLLAYVVKYALISVMMLTVAANRWPGGLPMAWGIAGGVVALTAVQVWWVSRLDRRANVLGSTNDR
jgi:hypothetical protein